MKVVETSPVLSQIRRVRILGVPVDIVPNESLEAVIKILLERPGSNQIVYLRTLDLMRARRNPELLTCLNNAALVVPVSMGLKHAAKKLHHLDVPRYPPFQFLIRVLNVLESIKGSIFLLGDRQPSLKNIENNIKHTFPGSSILGRYTGNYPRQMERNIVTAVNKSSPNLLLCGPGIKGKMLWIYRNRGFFQRGIQLWSSEFFDYIIARKKRPSLVSFRKGREFYRESVKRPWRITRLVIYMYFHWLILWTRAVREL